MIASLKCRLAHLASFKRSWSTIHSCLQTEDSPQGVSLLKTKSGGFITLSDSPWMRRAFSWNAVGVLKCPDLHSLTCASQISCSELSSLPKRPSACCLGRVNLTDNRNQFSSAIRAAPEEQHCAYEPPWWFSQISMRWKPLKVIKLTPCMH